MEGYESIFILDPDSSQDQQTVLLGKFKNLIASKGGAVVHETTWGRRRLAYEVKKKGYGIYHLFYIVFTCDVDYVLRAYNICFERFKRVVLTHRYVLERRRVEADVDVLEGKVEIFIAKAYDSGGSHKWFYDFDSLKHILESAGFTQVKKCGRLEGAVPDLEMIEPLGRELETLYVEAVKL